MSDQVTAQVRFVINRDGLSFSDAIFFPLNEYLAMTPEQVEEQKELRFQHFKNHLQSTALEAEEQYDN